MNMIIGLGPQGMRHQDRNQTRVRVSVRVRVWARVRARARARVWYTKLPDTVPCDIIHTIPRQTCPRCLSSPIPKTTWVPWVPWVPHRSWPASCLFTVCWVRIHPPPPLSLSVRHWPSCGVRISETLLAHFQPSFPRPTPTPNLTPTPNVNPTSNVILLLSFDLPRLAQFLNPNPNPNSNPNPNRCHLATNHD